MSRIELGTTIMRTAFALLPAALFTPGGIVTINESEAPIPHTSSVYPTPPTEDHTIYNTPVGDNPRKQELPE